MTNDYSMLTRWITFLVIVGFSNLTLSQNLVPNPSFESSTDLIYQDPPDAFMHLDFWYMANFYGLDSQYEGTPDLFDSKNPWPLSDKPSFWNIAKDASDGNFHVGLVNNFRFEGYLTPEAIGVPLIEPLETNDYYHIELQVRNKGISNFDKAPILCVQPGYKDITILLGQDSVFVVIDSPNNDSYVDASKVIKLRSTYLESNQVGGWNKIGTCFQADGGEQFLGITTTPGLFTVDSPCKFYDEHWDLFYVYYFDIDDIKLTKLPKEIILNQTICEGRPTKFNIDKLVNLPTMQDEIQYHWPDGRVDSINYISEAGTYLIDAVIDCTTIPIEFNIQSLQCDPLVYVPNVFSPESNEPNNHFKAFISIDLPLIDFEFSVYNRWGSLVFISKDVSANWDGTFQGQKMDIGVYVWTLEYTVDDIELGVVDYKETGDVLIVK